MSDTLYLFFIGLILAKGHNILHFSAFSSTYNASLCGLEAKQCNALPMSVVSLFWKSLLKVASKGPYILCFHNSDFQVALKRRRRKNIAIASKELKWKAKKAAIAILWDIHKDGNWGRKLVFHSDSSASATSSSLGQGSATVLAPTSHS